MVMKILSNFFWKKTESFLSILKVHTKFYEFFFGGGGVINIYKFLVKYVEINKF